MTQARAVFGSTPKRRPIAAQDSSSTTQAWISAQATLPIAL
jgi:hypothetical protein